MTFSHWDSSLKCVFQSYLCNLYQLSFMLQVCNKSHSDSRKCEIWWNLNPITGPSFSCGLWTYILNVCHHAWDVKVSQSSWHGLKEAYCLKRNWHSEPNCPSLEQFLLRYCPPCTPNATSYPYQVGFPILSPSPLVPALNSLHAVTQRSSFLCFLSSSVSLTHPPNYRGGLPQQQVSSHCYLNSWGIFLSPLLMWNKALHTLFLAISTAVSHPTIFSGW